MSASEASGGKIFEAAIAAIYALTIFAIAATLPPQHTPAILGIGTCGAIAGVAASALNKQGGRDD